MSKHFLIFHFKGTSKDELTVEYPSREERDAARDAALVCIQKKEPIVLQKSNSEDGEETTLLPESIKFLQRRDKFSLIERLGKKDEGQRDLYGESD